MKAKQNKATRKERKALSFSMFFNKSQVEKLVKKRRAAEHDIQEESLLVTPTSLSMKNSFLIKTVGKTFDNLSTKKQKRKLEVSIENLILISNLSHLSETPLKNLGLCSLHQEDS